MNFEIAIDGGKRSKAGLAAISVHLPESGTTYGIDLAFDDLYASCGYPNRTALEFLVFAACCYLIDRSYSRRETSDSWTRRIELSFPVHDPAKWIRASGNLAGALSFLTGDEWVLEFPLTAEVLCNRPLGPSSTMTSGQMAYDAACLFSGGLDSLAGAIDLFRGNPTKRVLLIGHYDLGGPKKVQRELVDCFPKEYSSRVGLLQIRVSQRPLRASETTLRSRSLMFIALGVYAAQSLSSKHPLFACENGLIALNIALTPSRAGSCSTRTMHPYYLRLLDATLADLAIGTSVMNPFRHKTKGECLVSCLDRAALKKLAPLTVSCSHAFRRQHWVRRGARNCGYCIPCIFRRAALRKAAMDTGSDYGIDVLAGELSASDSATSADDLRAVLDFLKTPVTGEQMTRRILAVASIPDLAEYAEMARRGFLEVATLFAKQGSIPQEKA